MSKLPSNFNIITMVCDPDWLGDKDISVPQLAILKAIYGLEMTPEEREAFLEMTEGRAPRKGGYNQATLICGRRSGKTDKIAANVALYETITFDPATLSPGELGYFFVVAQSLDAAATARGYIEGKALLLEKKGWDVLDHGAAQERAITGKQIRFLKRVVVQCFPCTRASTRGKTGIGYVGDEAAQWHTDVAHYNPDVEVIRALRGTLATQRYSKGIVISTPFGEDGVLWEHWEKRKEARRLVVNAPSWVLNPSISKKFLQNEQEADPEGYMREFGAQFGRTGGTYLSGALVDECLRKDGPLMLPPKQSNTYAAQVDVAFTHDRYAFGVAHVEGQRVVVDLIKIWQGSKRRPVDEAEVTQEIAGDLRLYGLDQVIGDQFASVPTQNEYAKNGIKFLLEADTRETNHEMFKNLKAAMRRGLLEIPKVEAHGDEGAIRKDLLSLVATMTSSGALVRVAAPKRKGFTDDISKVIASLTQKLLPLSSTMDIAEWNRTATKESSNPMVDWHEPSDGIDIGMDIMTAEL